MSKATRPQDLAALSKELGRGPDRSISEVTRVVTKSSRLDLAIAKAKGILDLEDEDGLST